LTTMSSALHQRGIDTAGQHLGRKNVSPRHSSRRHMRAGRNRPVVSWAELRRVLLGRNYRSRRWHFLVNAVGGSFLLRHRDRAWVYRVAGIDTATADIRPGAFFVDAEVSVGAGTFVNHRCYFSSWARIEIGQNCDIGNEVMFGTVTHDIGPATRRAGQHRVEPIAVGAGCWIGARAQILPGVTIGPGCVVAAGSVVSSDCPAHTLVAGVPAIAKRKLDVETNGYERLRV
jgi:maltose O-acetyltransferase